MSSPNDSKLGWFLGAMFVFAMLMATGPGVLLANHPVIVLGLPLLYLWAIVWYLVIVIVSLVAYALIWNRNDNEEDDS